MDILSFLKEVSSVFEKCQFLVALFSFSEKNILYKKRQFLGKWVKLWVKVTSVSININFGAKMSILCGKNWNFGRNVDSFNKCALLQKLIIFLQNMLIFRKMWHFMWRFIYINKMSYSDKNYNFFGYVNLFMC